MPGKPLPPDGLLVRRISFMGCFFVEFLRTQCDLPDIQPRTARLVLDMSQGMTYEDAFQKEIGMSLEAAKSRFISYLSDNAGPARLRGTVWQDL
jgi:hypothetical protein